MLRVLFVGIGKVGGAYQAVATGAFLVRKMVEHQDSAAETHRAYLEAGAIN